MSAILNDFAKKLAKVTTTEPMNEDSQDLGVDPNQNTDGTDALAVFSFVVLILTVASMLSFMVYLSCKADTDARNHPYHQEYEHH